MSLQYLTNLNPPPAQSVLQYSVSPDIVFVSTATQQMYANLTITVFNPSHQAVTCQAFQFGFYVGAQYGDLTASAASIQSSAGQAAFAISKQATGSSDEPTLYQFSAPPAGMANFQLAPQQSLVFHLNGVLINQAVGEGGTQFVITEVTGPSSKTSMVQGGITISKETPTLDIKQFTVNPPIPINPGDALALNWQVTASDHQQLYNTNTGALLYDSKNSDHPVTSYTDHPQRHTTYELIAWAGQLFTAQQKSAMVNAPLVTATPASITVDALTEVTIKWTARSAQTVSISPPPASGPATVDATSGQGSFLVKPRGTTTYTLNATGANNANSPPAYVIVNVNPVQIDSFQTASSGESLLLSWKVESATQIELDINGVPKPFAPSINSYEAHPKEPTSYVLKAYGQHGPAICSLTRAPALLVKEGGKATLGPISNTQFNEFTIEMWLQPLSEHRAILFSPILMCQFTGRSPGAWSVLYGDIASPFMIDVPWPLHFNTWEYIALSSDGASFFLTLGENTTSVKKKASLRANHHYLLQAHGYFAEVRFWNVCRSAAQIQSDRCHLQAPQPGLVAYYNFTQLPFQDISGNRHPFELTDATTSFVEGPCPLPERSET